MHHSRNASTPTNTGVASRTIRMYRSWMACAWVLTPSRTHPLSSRVQSRGASNAPNRRTRIWSAHRELVDHADGEVVRAARVLGVGGRGATLPAGDHVGARRQVEDAYLGRSGADVGDLTEVQVVVLGLVLELLGVGDDVVRGLAGGDGDQDHLVVHWVGLFVGEVDQEVLVRLHRVREAAVLELRHRDVDRGQRTAAARLITIVGGSRVPFGAAAEADDQPKREAERYGSHPNPACHRRLLHHCKVRLEKHYSDEK